MLLWALIVGLSFPAVGLLSEGLPPLSLTALRFAIAALAIWPLVRHAPGLRPGLRGLALYAVMGLCLAGFFGAMFWAAHRVSALSMATLYVGVPLIAFGLGRGIGVERPGGRLPAILALGAAGALGLAWAGADEGSAGLQPGIGEAVFFAGCVASAAYPVLSKWGLAQGILAPGAAVRTFWSLLAGAATIGLMGAVGEAPGALLAMTPIDLALVAYLGIVSSGVTFWLQQRATAVLTPGRVKVYTYLVPFVSAVLLLAAEPQRLGWSWLPGALLVVLAITLMLRRDARASDPA